MLFKILRSAILVFLLATCAFAFATQSELRAAPTDTWPIPAGTRQGTEETATYFDNSGQRIPIMTIRKSGVTTAPKYVLLWQEGSEQETSHPMYGRWLSEIAANREDVVIISVGKQGITPNSDGTATVNPALITNSVKDQAASLIKLADFASTQYAINGTRPKVCVCGFSEGSPCAVKAATEPGSKIDSVVSIAGPLGGFKRAQEFQQTQAMLAFRKNYGLPETGEAELTKENFKNSPKPYSQQNLEKYPQWADAARGLGPRIDGVLESYFSRTDAPLKLSLLDGALGMNRQLIQSGYDFEKDPDHILPPVNPNDPKASAARQILIKANRESYENFQLSPGFQDVVELNNQGKKVLLYQGENDSLVPAEGGFDELYKLRADPKYQWISPFYIKDRGHDIVNFGGISMPQWLGDEEIPYDPIRDRLVAEVQQFVTSE